MPNTRRNLAPSNELEQSALFDDFWFVLRFPAMNIYCRSLQLAYCCRRLSSLVACRLSFVSPSSVFKMHEHCCHGNNNNSSRQQQAQQQIDTQHYSYAPLAGLRCRGMGGGGGHTEGEESSNFLIDVYLTFNIINSVAIFKASQMAIIRAIKWICKRFTWTRSQRIAAGTAEDRGGFAHPPLLRYTPVTLTPHTQPLLPFMCAVIAVAVRLCTPLFCSWLHSLFALRLSHALSFLLSPPFYSLRYAYLHFKQCHKRSKARINTVEHNSAPAATLRVVPLPKMFRILVTFTTYRVVNIRSQQQQQQ